MSDPNYIAVLCADLHLSHRPPVARSAETDWYAAMARQLDELRGLVTSPTGEHKIPVLCAGDLFDDGWRPHRCPPELINLALSHLPKMYGIPGQHDLPHHEYKQLRKSAYWTLVKAGRIIHLEPGQPVEIPGKAVLRVRGFPWGTPVRPCTDPHDLCLEVALIHAFVWMKGTGYEGAPREQRVKGWQPKLKGFDVAVFGDNHCPFDFRFEKEDGPWIFNTGGFYRRRSDERTHKPSVGLLYADGTIQRHYLDVSNDCFLDVEKVKEAVGIIGVEDFLEALASLEDTGISWPDAVRRSLKKLKVTEPVRRIVLQALGETP